MNAGASERTVTLTHAVLHRALKQALKWGIIGHNPVEAVNRPRLTKKEMKILTDDQARTFLSAAKESHYEALFYLAISTGMREGEIFGLKWSDLDWNTRVIQVKRQLQHISGKGLCFTEPKSATGQRAIVLSTMTITVLRNHLDNQNFDRLLAGDRWKENDLIFSTKIGTPMYPMNMFKDFKFILKKTGLPDIRFHDLRHYVECWIMVSV